MSEPSSLAPEMRKKLLLSVALTALVAMIMGALYLHFATDRQAEKLTLTSGDRFALQSELLIRPLILANDRVSLNYLLNELNKLEHISGLQVQDNQGIVIARAGSTSDLKQVKRLQQQERTIATLTLWLDAQVAAQQLRSQHMPLLLLATLTLISLLVILLWLTREKHTDSEEGLELEDDFSAALSTEEERYESLSFAAEPEASASESSSNTMIELPVVEIPTELPTTPTTYEEPAEPEITVSTATEIAQKTETPEPLLSKAPVSEPQQNEDLQTESLVDLLKPEPKSQPTMPKFEHHPQDLEAFKAEPQKPAVSEEKFELQEQDIKTIETEPAAAHKPSTENPLFKLDDREEVQLDLYSFEHELELILPSQDAIYLFYIDTHTASSENMKADEKDAMLHVYLQLAKQVARIYNGDCEQLENKDIVLRFELRDDKDSHGVNSLCAAMLFSLLYKGFNQARIRGFQPVLSLQMALARGHFSKYDLVKEEAHFLTRTTHTNELISHTALTEAPLVKQAALNDADIRREDEDKVLVLKLTTQHQALLQKQANHLLTKIFKKK